MAFIESDYEPKTEVRILASVPMDNTYTDQICWVQYPQEVAQDYQTEYFKAKTKYTFTEFTYQRTDSKVKGGRPQHTIRVPLSANQLQSVNYLMWNNNNKWYYAFINQVNWVNDNCAEIVYEIDMYQTWQFKMEAKECWVIREHPASDGYFANTEPEPINVDYYDVASSTIIAPDLEKRSIVMLATENVTGDFSEPDLLDGIFCGLYYKAVSALSGAADVKTTLDAFTTAGKTDAIVAIYMTILPPQKGSIAGATVRDSGIAVKSLKMGGGYTAKHAKLASYPYRFFKVRSYSGDEVILYPQLCKDGSVSFYFYEAGNTQSCVMLVPKNYQGRDISNENTVTFSETIAVPWIYDNFTNYMEQNRLKILTNIGGAAISGYGLTKSAEGALMGGGLALLSEYGNMMTQYTRPDQERGTAVSGSTAFACGRIGFEIIEYVANANCAKRLDAYFNSYGYATNRYKVPRQWGNSPFNYVQTGGAVFGRGNLGSAPVDAVNVVKAMFDGGVRLWNKDSISLIE